MRVAYLDTTANPYDAGATGLRDIAWEMAAAAASLGVEAYLAVPTAVTIRPPSGVKTIQFSPVPFCQVNVLGHLLTILRTGYELKSSGIHFDYLHAPEYATTGVLSPMSRTPVISTVSGNIYDRIENGNPFGPVTTQVFKLYTKSTARFSSTIIAVSKSMERWWLRSGTQRCKLKQIPAGVDIKKFSPQNVDPQGLGFHPDKFTIIFVGRLSQEKGLGDLLDAMSLLRHQHIEVHLFGAGPMRAEIEGYIQKHDLKASVHLRGPVARTDLPYLYSAADLTVLPSYTEALPRVMMESMASGCAFLGTRISGIEDHIIDGVTGFIIPPHSPIHLAKKITDAAKDRSQLRQIADQGRSYVCSTLAWTKVMCRVLSEVYNSNG